MSYLAIGAVTRAVVELLTRKLNKPALMGNNSFRVTSLPPDDERVNEENGINVFLYRIAESPFAKNMEWRGDRVHPAQGGRSPLALTLSYLITAYAKKTAGTIVDEITAHQLLGNSMTILHDSPVLNDVHDSDFDADLDAQFPAELRNSFEKVKLSLLPITMEEFSKIWTGFSKAYRLSVAYEASLIQIGPAAAAAAGLPVQRAVLGLSTIQAPMISLVDPPSGAAGAEVIIKGQGFRQPGRATVLNAGDIEFSEADLISVAPEEIRVKIPEAPQHGPRIAISVTVGGMASLPATYEVSPWIRMVSPLRGIPGVPLAIPFEVPSGASVSAEIDGQAVAAAVDTPGKTVTAMVPLNIATNGSKTVLLIVNDGTAKRSNARFFEVLPLIDSVQFVSAPMPPTTTITITGERLNGSDVSIQAGSLLVRKGANAAANQIVVQVNRLLAPGVPVSVTVDGRISNTIPPRLDRIDPPGAFAGDPITLEGNSLSGRSVIISFGGMQVNLHAQAAASRLRLNVPAGLAAGVVQVKATVDGRDTNSRPFQVLG